MKNILKYDEKLFSTNYRNWLNEFVLDEKFVCPQIIELDPTTNCMFACPECINAELLNGTAIPQNKIYQMIDEFSQLGVQGIIFIGGGEPLMYPNFDKLLAYSKNKGLKNGITTNGLLIDKYLETISECAEWVRVSMDASTSESFQIARPSRIKNSFARIIKGMENLARNKTGLLGYSFLLLETRGFNNAGEIYDAAKLAKEIGCDYFEFKPMVDQNHYLSKYSVEFLKTVWEQQEKMKELENETFKIMIPHSMDMYKTKGLSQKKEYHECPVMKLRTLVTSEGIYPCPYKRGQRKFNMGKIESSFLETYKTGFEKINSVLDPSKDCGFYCIRNDINEILLKLLTGEIELTKIGTTKTTDVFV